MEYYLFKNKNIFIDRKIENIYVKDDITSVKYSTGQK